VTDSAVPAPPFGARLRQWRTHRGLSQLTLAHRASTTARHVSFLETGRSRPSRDMVLRLGQALDVPLRGINDLLRAAGLAAAYLHTPLQAADLAGFRIAIDAMLAAHLPYPALVLDGYTNVVQTNTACAALFGTQLTGRNFVRDFLANPQAAQLVDNWPQVAWAGLDRLRAHLDRSPFDSQLADLVRLAETSLASMPRPEASPTQLTVCPSFRLGGQLVRTIVLAARFDAPAEVTLDELRIELIYPADPAAEQFFRQAR